MIYRAIVAKRLRKVFDHINAANYEPVVAQFSDDAEHWFSGSTPLSGRRNTPASIRAWYERLETIFPDLHFDITTLSVDGWPWHTTASIEWVDTVSDRSGQKYSNRGVHYITLKWGKATSLRVYCDTQLLDRICQTLAKQGVEAAAQPPIED